MLFRKKRWLISDSSTYSEVRESGNKNRSGEDRLIDKDMVSLMFGQSFLAGIISGSGRKSPSREN